MSEFLGKTIGDFQLVEDLDESGETMVFKGFQPSMNRYAAVKMLKPSAARDPNAVQQFLQQGELMARMQHPNILEVYNSGQEGGVVYRAERLAESGSLGDHLSWFYEPDQVLGLMNEIVGGLEYIHGHGYVHGNLKPNNILLDARQKPLLADFGTPPRQTQPPSPYLAPEQVQGGVVDARADVYALGVLVTEVLTGQAPPPGMVVSPRARRPELPEALERVIFKAKAQNPDQRFQSVGEFRAAMENALQAPAQPTVYQQAPAPAPTPSVSQSVTLEGQRGGTNWLAIVLGIIVVGILCVGGFFGFRVLMGDQGAETPEAPPTQPPPGATIIVPTVVFPTQGPLPTQPPAPTQPPPEPTQPPLEPTQPPEQPTEEAPPPDEAPPEEGAMDEPPALLPDAPPADRERPQIGDLPELCGSVGFIVIGLGLVSVTRLKKKR
jgi:serine/threonine-protein kinase